MRMIRMAEQRLTERAEVLSDIRDGARYAIVVAFALVLAPAIAAHATEPEHRSATITSSADTHGFGEHVKRDAKAVGAAFKEGAHRVGVAAKAVGHEIATAAKRGAAQTRTAMRGEKVDKTAANPAR